MGLLGWFFELPPLTRFLIALVPLGISGAMLAGGTFWPWGWGVGAIMLCCSFPTSGERNKWGDW